ncbi:hypothetical protein QEZ54_08675 [Catellatospora sp. KI3]|uniref:hypothetical protein n=1 Tax=Catellatospora sp. KI3 TaxID=3041620 RepID=UPI0024823F8F|nr:hypothetical protein [Catellatospora sp. KI3]MDI1461036.1 hypothetical protein [Catellatospora sp. KI3]
MLLLCAACTSPPATPAPPTLAPASPSPQARDVAVAAYISMWRAYEKALAAGDPNAPDLRTYADGPALQLLTRAVRSTSEAGLRGAGTTTLSPNVVGMYPIGAPTRATITDCMDTSSTRVYRPDGQPYADNPGGARQMTATVVLSADGTWRVTQIKLGQVGSC